jgi:glutamyl-tRNA(Gln) amidotransferase subunit D
MVGEAEAGDRVEVRCGGKTYVGILMPRPDLADRGFLTLKLKSGYDLGLPESGVESVKVLQRWAPTGSRPQKDVPRDAAKPLVSILSTGGTIASRVDYATGGVYASSTAADLLEGMPELAGLADIRTGSVMNVMSEDMHPKLWVKVAEAVAGELNAGADGVVVTHGTDTMHFSTAAMSFMLRGLGKPVVFTGAQRSTDRGSADSFMNLLSSVAFARSDYAGVYLVMHGSMSDDYCLAHRGTKVRKMHTTRRDAFQSVNAAPVARIFPDGRVEAVDGGAPKRAGGKVAVESRLQENVALVKIHPGIDPGLFDYYMERKVRGVVLEGTALGHVPTRVKETSLIPKIEEMVGAGVLVAMATQCVFGRVNPYVYSNLREVSSRGVVYCEDMLAETAYVKMMWALGKTGSAEKAGVLMLENVAGEFSDRSRPETSLPNL